MSTSNENEVQQLDSNIADAVRTLARSLGKAVHAGRSTCVHCIYFKEAAEVCTFYTPQARPPARVIAFGCPEFDAETIPF